MSTHPPDLSEAARALLARRAKVTPDAGPRLGAAAESAPLASTQLSQWLSSQMALSDDEGLLPKVLRLEGPLDRAALRRALTELIRRHQILRTVFSVSNGEAVQRATPPRDVDLPEIDLRDTPAGERAEAARALLDEEARRRLDLSRDLLMRPVLVQLEDQVFELQVTFQHVAFDGWSNGIYLRELGALYSAYVTGRESPLPELPFQYADFATWERSRAAMPSVETDRAYWADQMSGSTAALGLLTDRPRRRQRKPPRASVKAAVGAALTARLARMALEEGTTLFAVTFGAFQVLVGRRADRHDFVLGVVSANRTLRDTEDLIGSFITVLPFRTRLDDAPTFRRHLRRTAESLTKGLAHQAFPFQRLMTELRPGGDPGLDPLYDVLFNYRNMPFSLPEMSGLVVSDFRAPHLTASYDLHLNVTPESGGLTLELEYNPDLFRADTASRWLAGYQELLEAVVSDPDISTMLAPVMPPAERRLLLEEWSGVAVPAPGSGLVLDRFERWAVSSPDAPAIEQGDRVLSYRELAGQVRALSARLRQAGISRGDRIGVSAGRSIETVTAALAIFSIGAVYVPLDPATPRRRLDPMLEGAGIRVILTGREDGAQLAERPERMLCIPDLLKQEPGAILPRAELGPADPAYIIFTSGSTGVPKGVVIPHGALAQYSAGSTNVLDVRPGDRFLHFHELTFDTSIEEMFVPLYAGATIVVRPDSMIDSPARFADHARALRLTHIIVPTAFWLEVITANWPRGMDLGHPRLVAIGGEAAAPDSIARFFAIMPPELDVRLFNGYGPTETTVAVTWAELRRGEEYPGEVPIGRPYAGAVARVVDRLGQPVPIGTPGELWVGGGSLGLGYLGAPELTAERFVGDPLDPAAGVRFYRTGDQVRWRDDGQIGYLGRIDSQIKVRGYRVEPGEIELALRAIPGIRQGAVVLHPGGRDRLVAFIVPDADGAPDPASIRDALALALPHYMVPSEIVSLARLPLTTTGKLDRSALKAMVPATIEATGGTLSTATEITLARIWEGLLGVTGIGADDRFLDLGGHSILAMRMANRVREQLGVELTIRTVLSHPTVPTLARELDRLQALVGEAPHH